MCGDDDDNEKDCDGDGGSDEEDSNGDGDGDGEDCNGDGDGDEEVLNGYDYGDEKTSPSPIPDFSFLLLVRFLLYTFLSKDYANDKQ